MYILIHKDSSKYFEGKTNKPFHKYLLTEYKNKAMRFSSTLDAKCYLIRLGFWIGFSIVKVS